MKMVLMRYGPFLLWMVLALLLAFATAYDAAQRSALKAATAASVAFKAEHPDWEAYDYHCELLTGRCTVAYCRKTILSPSGGEIPIGCSELNYECAPGGVCLLDWTRYMSETRIWIARDYEYQDAILDAVTCVPGGVCHADGFKTGAGSDTGEIGWHVMYRCRVESSGQVACLADR